MAVGLLVTGCSTVHVAHSVGAPTAGSPTVASPAVATVPSTTTVPSSPGPTPSTTTVPSSPALAVLATVRVAGRAPRTGYDRALFGAAWTDDTDAPAGHNGCDTRNDILRRDLVDPTLESGTGGCTVLSGTLHDPYTGRTVAFRRGSGTSSAVQIDHVVALGDAWQTGAQAWNEQTRAEFANDPLELLAVDGPTNQAKGDGDAATWLPPQKSYRCAYVARQVAVKARYRLWMTAAEHDASARVLARCPDQQVPTEGGAPALVPGTA